MRRDRSGLFVSEKTKASSMPIMKSYTEEVKVQQKTEEKIEKALQREAERAQKRLEKEEHRLPAEWRSRIFRRASLPKIPGIGLDEMELRKLLMDEAKSRMDMAEAGIIAQEPVEKLVERFEFLRCQDSGTRCQNLGSRNKEQGAIARSGPSGETRKELR